MILITGATGQLGSAVIENLLKTVRPQNIAALARNADKAKQWVDKGIIVRNGDYGDKKSLARAFEGVETVLLITSNGENALSDHRNVIEAAQKAHVRHICYTSGARNDKVEESRLGPLWDSYVTTENDIKESGIPFTILRCGLYTETIPFFLGEQVLDSGILFPAGEGKAAFATRGEMGEAIANIMAGEGHENRSYLITGEKTYSFHQIAAILSELSGKSIGYVSPQKNEYKQQLENSGVPKTDIEFAMLFAAIIENNEYDICDDKLAKILGRKPISLRSYLHQVYIES